MLPNLPHHLDDELWFSVLARIRASMGSISHRRFARIFDFQAMSVLLTRNLAGHAAKFPSLWNLSADQLLARHTIFPYLASTVDPSAEAACRALLYGAEDGRALPADYAFALRPGAGQRATLRFCTECVEEDIRQVGEAAWKRSHNLPEVYVCHRHARSLLSSDVPLKYPRLTSCPGSDPQPVVSPYPFDVSLWLARESAWILNAPYASLTRRGLKGALRVALYGRGWPRGVIKVRREITAPFVEAYGLDNLRRLRFQVVDGIPQLGRELVPTRGIHPARLIVLLHSRGLRAESVLGQEAGDPAHEAALQPLAQKTLGPGRIVQLRTLLLGHPPSEDRTQSIRAANSLLKRHDAAWHSVNAPAVAVRQRARHGMLDDKASAELVEREARRLIRASPSEWVTRTALLRVLGLTVLARKRHARYPETTAALEACIDTRETYYERRVKWQAGLHVERGLAVSWSEFREVLRNCPRALVEEGYRAVCAQIGSRPRARRSRNSCPPRT